MTNKEVYRALIDKYGVQHQIIKTIEELSELTKELTKYLNNDEAQDNLFNICDELADCKIMLDQMELLFDTSGNKIDYLIRYKIIRVKMFKLVNGR